MAVEAAASAADKVVRDPHKVYVDGLKFSNPLYFKTVLVPILATWPLILMVLTIYLYNLWRVIKSPTRNYRVTMKMNFFPMLLFAMILDNGYDWTTSASVNEFSSKTLGFLIGVFGLLAGLSLVFVAAYTWDSIQSGANNGFKPNEEGAVLSGGSGDSDRVDLPSRLKYPGRWRTIINEYITINVVYGLAVYNLLLLIVYVMRYTTHVDENYMRESDVAYASLAIIILLVPLIIMDYFMFRFPPTASIMMHYYLVIVFGLSFTVDFFNQVKYCELITLVVTFGALFLFVFKIKIFTDIGCKISMDKTD